MLGLPTNSSRVALRSAARCVRQREYGNRGADLHFLARPQMVMYEAARAICALPHVVPRDLAPAVRNLGLFLSSPKPALRFAAVKTLSKVAMTYPSLVAKCNDDLEGLIGDLNRTIATLAITTLLKTGAYRI